MANLREVLEGVLEKVDGGGDGYVSLGTNSLKNIKSYRLFLFEKRQSPNNFQHTSFKTHK